MTKKSVKATFVQDETRYAVQVGKVYLHAQDKNDISLSKYIKLTMKNYPDYNYQVEKELAIDNKYDPNRVDITTGEIIDNNNQNPKQMETKKVVEEPKTKQEFKQEAFINNFVKAPIEEAPVEEPIKPTPPPVKPGLKLRRVTAKGAETLIKSVAYTGIGSCYVASDIMAFIGNTIAELSATVVKPLGNHSDMSRSDIAEDMKTTCNSALLKTYATPKNLVDKLRAVKVSTKLSPA